LLIEREFIELSKNIYKIGRTKQKNLDRVNQYPKQSILLFQIACIDSIICEKNLKQIFSIKFIKHPEIGTEYFEGNPNQMIDIIYNYLKKPNQIQIIYEKPEEIIPEVPKEIIPEVPKETIPEVPKEIIPEVPKEIIPEVPKEAIPEVPKETIPEVPKEIIPEVPKETIFIVKYNYHCEKCFYSTNYKSCFTNHLSSQRHNSQEEFTNVCYCGKRYKTESGLWKHKISCEKHNDKNEIINTTKKLS
jgi:hypothetical protein